MSSFVVDSDVIDFLVTAVQRYLIQPGNVRVTYGSPSQVIDLRSLTHVQIGRLLWDENVAGVEGEYGGTIDEEIGKRVKAYRYKMWSGPGMGAVQVIKTCQFLRYQSMDAPEYEARPAAVLLDMLQHAAIYRLPGYDEAVYGVPARV